MPELSTLLELRGSLSEELVASKFFIWWTGRHVKSKCWLNHPRRTAARDRLFEKYLQSRGLGPNARAYVLATLLTPALAEMGGEAVDLNLEGFLNAVKLAYPDPVKLIMDVLESAETDVMLLDKSVGIEYTEEHQRSIEENIELLISVKWMND